MRVKQPAKPGDGRRLLRASDPVTKLYESRLVDVVVHVVIVECVVVRPSVVRKQGSGEGNVRYYISGEDLG